MIKENGLVIMQEKEYEAMKTRYNISIEEFEKRIKMLQEALIKVTSEHIQQDVEIPRVDFVEIYDRELNRMFDIGDRGEISQRKIRISMNIM